MTNVRGWAGLYVHARSVLAVTMDSETGELRLRRLSGDTEKVLELAAVLPGPTRPAYEAGPTGYGSPARLTARGSVAWSRRRGKPSVAAPPAATARSARDHPQMMHPHGAQLPRTTHSETANIVFTRKIVDGL